MTDARAEGLPEPPFAPERPHVLIAHGDTRTDSWYWLRDRDDPDVIAHLQAENAYTDAALARAALLEDRLYQELKARAQEGDTSAPARKGPWWYYARTVPGLEYTVHCRRHDPERALNAVDVMALAGGPGEHVVLDENRLAGTSDYFALGVVNLSPDHCLVAYAVDRIGDERYALRFRDVASGTDRGAVIEDVYYSSAWSTDNRSFFYVRHDDAMRPHQVWCHVLGSHPTTDTLVFEELDERFHVQVGLTRSERFVVVTCHSKASTEVWYLDAGQPSTAPTLVEARRDGVQYVIEDAVMPGRGAVWLILANDGGAENFALYHAPVAEAARSNWDMLLPHRPEVKLESVDTFGSHAVVVEREQGQRHLNVIRLTDRVAHRIPQPEAVYTVSNADSLEFDTATVRFGYTSLVTPPSTFEYDLETGARTLVKQEPVPGYDPSRYETTRVWARAPDGVRVPITLLHTRGFRPDGRAPCLLYGYGAYEVTIEPTFSPSVVSLVERGFVFAVAHVRGGGELGRWWYDDGKLERKHNSFSDFVACAEHLIGQGYTSAERLVIRSRSAGGTLLGAVANMRPDLFAAVVAEVPFVDCLTTLFDDTLPLTIAEREEWGDPVADPEAYAMIKSYSPYDNVVAADYPAIYTTAALNDQRVGYWEPAKWVAKLRATSTGDRPVFLKTEMGTGHGGQSGRYQAWRDEARVQAFMLTSVGVTD